MNTAELLNLFRLRTFQAQQRGETMVDLRILAHQAGVKDLHQIGLAARQLAAESDDNCRLECTMETVIFWINQNKQ